MTEQQRKAAEEALSQIKIDEIIKRTALTKRNDCIKDVFFYKLPYRVLYDLKQPIEEVSINYFYPHREYSKEICARIQEAKRENGGTLEEEAIKAIESAEYTPESLREYYFTCFLAGVDFETFRTWDWTGEMIDEAEAAVLKAYYEARQRDFLENPDKYASRALKCDEDMSRYNLDTQEMLELEDEILYELRKEVE